jgi:hypothetical protein
MLLTKVGRGWLRWTIVCALGLIVLAGCGGTKRLPVAGTVTLDGKPLDDAIITFAPDADKGNTTQISCSSPVKEGRYELKTTGTTRADSGSGAPPGWYKVIVRPQSKPPFMQPPATIPNKAGTSKRGQLLAGQKQRNRMPQPPKNPNPIPAQYSTVEKTPLEVEVKDNPQPGAYDFSLKSR